MKRIAGERVWNDNSPILPTFVFHLSNHFPVILTGIIFFAATGIKLSESEWVWGNGEIYKKRRAELIDDKRWENSILYHVANVWLYFFQLYQTIFMHSKLGRIWMDFATISLIDRVKQSRSTIKSIRIRKNGDGNSRIYTLRLMETGRYLDKKEFLSYHLFDMLSIIIIDKWLIILPIIIW